MTEPTTKTTLGQKIDALLEPMYEEAERHRGFIKLGKAKIAELESGLVESQSALAEIEDRMVQVLHSLAAEDPVLATALGGGRLPGPTKQNTPTPNPTPGPAPLAASEPTAATPTPTPAPPEPSPATPSPAAAPGPEAAAQAPAQPAGDLESGALPTEPELDDATAMDEISAMLDGPVDADTPQAPPMKIEDAATRAAEAADNLLAQAGDAAGQ